MNSAASWWPNPKFSSCVKDPAIHNTDIGCEKNERENQLSIYIDMFTIIISLKILIFAQRIAINGYLLRLGNTFFFG